jgi:uncharacterized protein (UPF0276 family)
MPPTVKSVASTFGAGPVPNRAGLGLRHKHMRDFVRGQPPGAGSVGWLEVHSENFLGDGGADLSALLEIRAHYPISCHSVALSLGSAEGIDRAHLARLKSLYDRLEPAMVSDHVSWSVVDGVYLNDLLPLPYTEEALGILCGNIDQAQDGLGRQILIENPSSYVSFAASTIDEADFIAEAARRTGCGLLLDVNNVFVSAHNHGFDARAYIDALPAEVVGEIHVAGHSQRLLDGAIIRTDDHGSPVIDPVWDLLDAALTAVGPKPVLVEWDTDVPDLAVLLAEAERAQSHIEAATSREASDAA